MGENGSTSTVPDVGMAESGSSTFMHSVSFQPDSAGPLPAETGALPHLQMSARKTYTRMGVLL